MLVKGEQRYVLVHRIPVGHLGLLAREWRKRRIIGRWAVSWVFVVIVGEVITGIVSNNPTFFQNYVPITLYYGLLVLVFSLLFEKVRYWLVLALAFGYGGVVEVLFFEGITIFWAAGLFYVLLFGVPYAISRKLWKG